MLQPEFLPFSLPLGAPHLKCEYYILLQADSYIYHWALMNRETGSMIEVWK